MIDFKDDILIKLTNFTFRNVIDLDQENIPRKLLWHLYTAHEYVFLRKTASGKHWHVITNDEERCTECEMYGDERFAEFRDQGKPFVLLSNKVYFVYGKKKQFIRKAQKWIPLSDFFP